MKSEQTVSVANVDRQWVPEPPHWTLA